MSPISWLGVLYIALLWRITSPHRHWYDYVVFGLLALFVGCFFIQLPFLPAPTHLIFFFIADSLHWPREVEPGFWAGFWLAAATAFYLKRIAEEKADDQSLWQALSQ
jgi:hypothetical protein